MLSDPVLFPLRVSHRTSPHWSFKGLMRGWVEERLARVNIRTLPLNVQVFCGVEHHPELKYDEQRLANPGYHSRVRMRTVISTEPCQCALSRAPRLAPAKFRPLLTSLRHHDSTFSTKPLCISKILRNAVRVRTWSALLRVRAATPAPIPSL